tara:strand:+ start:1914 stop:2990 length:1077 start_codon:yes stop_codon:yes gene_type:complete
VQPRIRFISQRFGISQNPHAWEAPDQSGWLKSALFGSVDVLSRRYCSHESKPIHTNMSRDEARKSLYLQARASSPFANPGIFMQFGKTRANIWTWDREAGAADLDLSSRNTVPESALHAPADGLVLRQSLDGYEGQAWRDGELMQSQWWPAEVRADQWSLFCLSVEKLGLNPVQDPVLLPTDYDRTSIPANDLPARSLLESVRISHWAVVAAAFILLPAIYLGLRYYNLSSQEARKQTELAALWQEKSTQRSAVAAINSALSKTQEISELFNDSHPLPILSRAIARVLDLGARVERVDYDYGDFRVMFTISENFDQSSLVRALESDPEITGVTLEPTGQNAFWNLRFREITMPAGAAS